MISFVRVDNRLIHGQVIEAWLPHLDVTRILVADEQAAANPLTRAAMGLAVPAHCRVEILPVADVDFAAVAASPDKVLVLLRDVADAVRAHARGLRCPLLNLGNVHFAPGRIQITPSVFLSPDELAELRKLTAAAVQIDVRAVPKDKALTLADLEARVASSKP